MAVAPLVFTRTTCPVQVVLVVAQDLHMSPGKLAAQCAHAAVGLYKLMARQRIPWLAAWEVGTCPCLSCWRMRLSYAAPWSLQRGVVLLLRKLCDAIGVHKAQRWPSMQVSCQGIAQKSSKPAGKPDHPSRLADLCCIIRAATVHRSLCRAQPGARGECAAGVSPVSQQPSRCCELAVMSTKCFFAGSMLERQS